MATRTEILGLVKPGLEDDADIRVINANMDILDKQIGEVNSVQKYKASWFDSVASMKAEPSLTEGAYVCTAGYYTPNDGGAASYLIRAKADTDIADNGSLHELANGLVAELIVENGALNVKQFGAVGNGVTDDSAIFQTIVDCAIAKNFKIYVPKGIYVLLNPIKITVHGCFMHLYGDSSVYPFLTDQTARKYGTVLVCTNGLFNGDDYLTANNTLIELSGLLHDVKIQTPNSTIEDTYVFNDIKLFHFNWYNTCTFCVNPLKGALTGVSHIHHNHFMHCKVPFCGASNGQAFAQESHIHHNYINGAASVDNYLFDVNFINWLYFHDNYVDYFGYLFNNSNVDGNIVLAQIFSSNNVYDTFLGFMKDSSKNISGFSSENDTFGMPTVLEANERYGLSLTEICAIQMSYHLRQVKFVNPTILYGVQDGNSDGTIYFMKGQIYAPNTLNNALINPVHSSRKNDLKNNYLDFCNLTFTNNIKDQRAFLYENGYECYDELPSVKNASGLQTIPNGYKCMVNGVPYIVSNGVFVSLV